MEPVKHDEIKCEFYLESTDEKAVLCYKEKEGSIDFYHTFVPLKMRGDGIAELLVRAGFEYAKQQKFKVIASCSYVKKLAAKKIF